MQSRVSYSLMCYLWTDQFLSPFGFLWDPFFQLWIFASYDEDSIEKKLEVFDSLLWYYVTVNLYAVSDVGCFCTDNLFWNLGFRASPLQLRISVR